MSPAHAAAGCALTMNAATRAAAPARNRRMSFSLRLAPVNLLRHLPVDGEETPRTGRRFPRGGRAVCAAVIAAVPLVGRGEGRAEHPEVRRRLVGQEPGAP